MMGTYAPGQGQVYVDQMFNVAAGSSTAIAAMNTGTTAGTGTYAPQLDGFLISISVIMTPSAATSLGQRARIELSVPNWKPNTLRFAVAGFGLATAPQAIGGNQLTTVFPVQQPVKTSWAITGNYVLFDSPVTVDIVVSGTFTGS
jgi:hypothetical protein